MAENLGDFSGGPVAKTLCCQGRDQGSVPGLGISYHISHQAICMLQNQVSACRDEEPNEEIDIFLKEPKKGYIFIHL